MDSMVAAHNTSLELLSKFKCARRRGTLEHLKVDKNGFDEGSKGNLKLKRSRDWGLFERKAHVKRGGVVLLLSKLTVHNKLSFDMNML